MELNGILIAESPIYRGNSIKTLFTRDDDGKHKFISLPGKIKGSAQTLMDAFIGESRNRRNTGLLNKGWKRLYGEAFPEKLISQVSSKLKKEDYPPGSFFDLRMGIKLDEERWAAEPNANYKMETAFKNGRFDFSLVVNDSELNKGENQSKLFYLLKEIEQGRFWFGAGKTKGLGRLSLKMNFSHLKPDRPPELVESPNHLRLDFLFDSLNPLIVGWNWGKKDSEGSESSEVIKGSQILDGFSSIPEPIRKLSSDMDGPISDPNNWNKKFQEDFPRKAAVWLKEKAATQQTTWTLTPNELKKLSKGKHAISKRTLSKLEGLSGKGFLSKDEAERTIMEALGKKRNQAKRNQAKRITEILEERSETKCILNEDTWRELATALKLGEIIPKDITLHLENEDDLTKSIEPLCRELFGRIYRCMDQQIDLAQSDRWIDGEISNRKNHIQIKKMIQEGRIDSDQWDMRISPEGIDPQVFDAFLNDHKKVRFNHMRNSRNLKKSITNDKNLIDFLKDYRQKTRRELSQDYHIDYRAGGTANREISRAYGKPYDKIFMRMLKWNAKLNKSEWEIYIPGSTIKGAFRKRASQILNTLIDDSKKIQSLLALLFGAQGRIGKIFFSDAYLTDPLDHGKAWCSSDGIRMNPHTGKPFDNSKRDYLFAYGKDLKFHFGIDIQDIHEGDLEGISLLWHLILDFQKGDIPIGGDRNSGFGWVKGEVSKLTWLAGKEDVITRRLFGNQTLTPNGIWQELKLQNSDARKTLKPFQNISNKTKKPLEILRGNAGFISHKAYGGLCGSLLVEAEVLSPLTIRESGSPSYTTQIDGVVVNGWDFFSFSPPSSKERTKDRLYALPSKSIKGALRHIYSIASDSKKESQNLGDLNPTDSLFGWVGQGPGNALAGRISISYGKFETPEISWFTAPHFYGHWQYVQNQWLENPESAAKKTIIDDYWRIFPHSPLIPDVSKIGGFETKDPNDGYFRAVMPGSKVQFSVRFWNLLDEELQRLIWCIGLEPNLAHKMGNKRYIGFGGIRFKIKPSSFFINWFKKYSSEDEDKEWQEPIDIKNWINPNVIGHYQDLKRELNADCL